MSSSTLQKKLENVNPKLVRNKIGWAVSLKISHCEGKVSLEKRKCAGKEEQDPSNSLSKQGFQPVSNSNGAKRR